MSKKAKETALKIINDISTLLSEPTPTYELVDGQFKNLKGLVTSICGDDWRDVYGKLNRLYKQIKDGQRAYKKRVSDIILLWEGDKNRATMCDAKPTTKRFQENKIKF